MESNTEDLERWRKKVSAQDDSYLAVGFCISEIPVYKLLQESTGYCMGQPGKRDVKRTHCLFVDDLKVHIRRVIKLERHKRDDCTEGK